MRRATILFRGQLQGCIIAAEDGAKGFDGKLVIGALGEAGDGDAAYDAGALNRERKRSAVGSVIGHGKALRFIDGFVLDFLDEPEGVGTAVESRDHIALAAHPLGVIGRGALKGRIEKRLTEAADIDDYGETALYGQRSEERAELPGSLDIEAR